ncbi:MAG: hypothetical protein QMD03_07080, partial [Syntrophales bacterium]|nr:hypothetical protein [Syntrophales bacterium]
CFKEFKRQVLLVYVGFIIIVIAYSFSEALAAYAFCGYIIIFFYYWTHLWSCARLIGKNPFLWVSISGFLSFLGPAYAYQMLKKSAEDQGYISSYILKPNAESVWRGNRAGWIAAIVTFCFFFAMFSFAQDPPKPLGGVIQGLIWGIIIGRLVKYLTKRPKHEKDKTA